MPDFLNNWGQTSGLSTPSVFPGMNIGDFGMLSSALSPASPDISQILGAPTARPPVTASLAGGLGGGMPKFGANLPTAQLALSGLSTIGNLWAAFQANKLAKEQFKYTKGVTETNLANSIKTYNTGLTDRANNRAIVEGRSPAETQSYIDANSLRRFGR